MVVDMITIYYTIIVMPWDPLSLYITVITAIELEILYFYKRKSQFAFNVMFSYLRLT